MKNNFVMLKIKDSDDGIILDTFLVKNPSQKALDGLQDLVDKRYDDDFEGDWDYSEVYEFVANNFEIIGYNEEIIRY